MLYVVDGTNRVVAVDRDWDAKAARTDGGAGVMRAQVVGQPLDRFIAGDATKMFVRAALDAARLLQQTRVLPYRCDSPEERRRFEMVISPLVDGNVQVEHRLVSSEARLPRGRIPESPLQAGWRCSQCLWVRLAGSTEWRDVDGFVPLAQDVCPPCGRRVFDSSATAPG
jgi:hypothetical protein